jgi:hypothetical protein
MIVWGKVIECAIDADVNYLNGELFGDKLWIKGKFLVFGNLAIFEKTVMVSLSEEKTLQVCSPIDATFMAYYEGMVAIMSFYFKDKDLYANISLTDPETLKSFINMSSFYKKYGISIPNLLDKIMYRKVPT